MAFFRDFLVLAVTIGIVTRLIIYFLKRKVSEKDAVSIAFLATLVILGPIAVVILGFDVAIAEFTIALIAWYIYDLLRLQVKK